MGKHCTHNVISLLRRLQWKLGIIDQELADAVGISRSYVTLMMNHNVPFQAKYRKPMEDYFYEVEHEQQFNEGLRENGSKDNERPCCQ